VHPKKPFRANYIHPSHYSRAFNPIPKSRERVIQIEINQIRASQSILNEKPLQTPHLDIDSLPLVDKYFQIKDISNSSHLLKLHCWSKDKFLNQNDDIHLWESNFPKYLFPQVYLFPKIIHFYQASYIPSERAIISPNQQILFTITTESINQML